MAAKSLDMNISTLKIHQQYFNRTIFLFVTKFDFTYNSLVQDFFHRLKKPWSRRLVFFFSVFLHNFFYPVQKKRLNFGQKSQLIPWKFELMFQLYQKIKWLKNIVEKVILVSRVSYSFKGIEFTIFNILFFFKFHE